MEKQQVTAWKDTATDFLVRYGFQLVGALVTLAVGLYVAYWVGKVVRQWLDRRNLEPPLKTLIVRVIRLVIVALVAVVVLEKSGVPIAPMIAGIGVIGVGIGLAVQGVLGNLVAGLVIIFTKPFRVGEFIEVVKEAGQVAQIELLSTTLLHADRSRVIIPNRKILGEILHNYGQMRQLDLTVGVAYDTDLPRALEIIRGVLARNPRVLKDPAPVVGVKQLADSSINIAVKPWVLLADFAAAEPELYQAMVDAFRADGISIPFPQREVRVFKDGAA